MNKNIYKVGVGLATAVLLSAFAPATFAQTIDVSGNGNKSDNTVVVSHENATVVEQSNQTYVTNNITVKSNTGGNTASKNTGGDVTVDTGDVTSDIVIEVSGGSNTATVDDCGCVPAASDVTVSGNGNKSDNKVILKHSNAKVIAQNTKTKVNNTLTVKSKTGKNKANKNTNGTVDVLTGSTTSGIGVMVTSGNNEVNP